MQIKRLEVEEGFLHGLKLDFLPGLNVLIGPRGVGKTSVIELIRYCLGVGAYTPENARAAEDHAVSILRGGKCILTVDIDGDTVELSRSEDRDRPDIGRSDAPIVLSQSEIERIGLDEGGRIRLLDDFIDESKDSGADRNMGRLLSGIASITQQLTSRLETIGQLEEEISSLATLDEELETAESERNRALEDFSELEPQRKRLEEVDEDLVRLKSDRDLLDEVLEKLDDWVEEIASVRVMASEILPASANSTPGNNDPLATPHAVLELMGDKLASAEDEGRSEVARLKKELKKVSASYTKRRDESRALRTTLEEAQEGAGEMSRRISALKEKVTSRESAVKRLAEAQASLAKEQEDRKLLLEEVDSARNDLYSSRKRIADGLSDRLGPQVKVSVVKYGLLEQYAETIAEAMQGSRLRYNQLAPKIAECMTPSELVTAVERGDADTIEKATRIKGDRAVRVVEALRKSGTADILRAQIDDAVEIGLLDGSDYKLTPEMSTGQRCTTILPILLSHTERVLVLDQPEDHLDNAYVADTVVKTLRAAPDTSQLIISTHNANIPVLGEATRVTLLESDGQRGFVKSSASLDSLETVSAITRVMEGGEEAFRLRAEFYSDHQGD